MSDSDSGSSQSDPAGTPPFQFKLPENGGSEWSFGQLVGFSVCVFVCLVGLSLCRDSKPIVAQRNFQEAIDSAYSDINTSISHYKQKRLTESELAEKTADLEPRIFQFVSYPSAISRKGVEVWVQLHFGDQTEMMVEGITMTPLGGYSIEIPTEAEKFALRDKILITGKARLAVSVQYGRVTCRLNLTELKVDPWKLDVS